MSARRLASICLLIFVNLLLGFFYFQSRRPFTWNEQSNEALSCNATDCLSELQELVFPKTSVNASVNNEKTEQIFPHPFHYIINNKDLCSRGPEAKSKLSVIILVCSAVNNFQNRQAIRETWGSIATSNNNTGAVVRLGFLLGSAKDESTQKMIENEALEHSDIIQENFYDSYRNLTIKSVMLLKWVTEHCENVHFVMKTDDDMYVNIAKLLRVMLRLPVKMKVMYGNLFRGARPNRDSKSKWYVPKEQFAADVFPDYLSGTGYVISRDVVPKLFEVSATLPFLVMEDVFITGLCASELGVRRFNVKGFAYWKRAASGCAFKEAITGHHVTIRDMRKIWRELRDNKLICRPLKKGS